MTGQCEVCHGATPDCYSEVVCVRMCNCETKEK